MREKENMHRVIYHMTGNKRIKEWILSSEDAILQGIDRGARGISVTRLPHRMGPSSWGYILLLDDIRGVGRQAFYSEV
jgi:hypothetical protein